MVKRSKSVDSGDRSRICTIMHELSLLCAIKGEMSVFFFFNDTGTTKIYTLSLHDALPISEEKPARASAPCADLMPLNFFAINEIASDQVASTNLPFFFINGVFKRSLLLTNW